MEGTPSTITIGSGDSSSSDDDVSRIDDTATAVEHGSSDNHDKDEQESVELGFYTITDEDQKIGVLKNMLHVSLVSKMYLYVT